jgi:hypothetical protein
MPGIVSDFFLIEQYLVRLPRCNAKPAKGNNCCA